jgi:hypothetical protein
MGVFTNWTTFIYYLFNDVISAALLTSPEIEGPLDRDLLFNVISQFLPVGCKGKMEINRLIWACGSPGVEYPDYSLFDYDTV